MSFILDALKKAERDRRRTHVPSLGTMHALPVERRSVWPWIVGGLVAVNAIAFVVVFVMRTGAPTPVPAPPAVVAPPPPAVVTPVAPVAVTPTAPPATPVARAPATPAPPVTRTTATPPERSPAREKPTRVEPEALKLEVLVYADDRAQRSAWINGARYVEGQRVDGRILVEQIQRDGVMLRTETKRYLLKQD